RALDGTAYAREHGLRAGLSTRAFRERAPVAAWEDVAPWVERASRGEPDVIVRGHPLAFERSGGSSGGGRLVPLTRGLLDEFAAATGPWMRDLAERHPALSRGTQYWAVSPVAQEPARTPGGARIGLADESEYLGPAARWAMRRLLALPPGLAKVRDVDRWRRETARRLVADADLALVSVWSPTFLLLLLDEIEGSLDAHLDAAPAPRARQVRAALRRGRSPAEALWPRLAVVSCWADGPSAAFVPEVRRRVPHAALEPKGLLATEGVVTIPLGGLAAPVAAVASHFVELEPVDAPGEPVLLHEAREGVRYAPLLTTSGGLVRYRLPDAVRCVGFHGAAPLLAYEGRLDMAADLCGEKVAQGQAASALARAWEKTGIAPAFALLAPSRAGRPHYRLFVETDAPRAWLDAAADVVDAALSDSHPYAYARSLGQLGPVRTVRVRNGRAAWERAHAARGRRLGSLKPVPLEPEPAWDDAFEEAAA
ncbi:MAG TPA: GH3 auxin-responsive promoter family protein, partial [Candidatus Thermoplasmatota archaeon]|nr:GH3 auxin-responsive promoter family protein [Candidatus Thermoplasmatota archaeon]